MADEDRTVMNDQGVVAYPSSSEQRRLWAIGQAGCAESLTVECAVTSTGDLHIDALRAAFEEVAREHDILRTTVGTLPHLDGPFQIVRADPGARQRSADPLRLPSNGRQLLIDTGTLLAEMREGRSRTLTLRASALAMDVRSLEILLALVMARYGGGVDATPPSPVQFADFAEYEAQVAESEDGLLGRRLWEARVNACDIHARPFHDRGAPVRFEPAWRTMSEVPRLLRPDIIAACWAYVLWQSCGRRDLLLGVLGDMRQSHPDVSDGMGRFERYVPIRVSLGRATTLGEIAASLERQQEEMKGLEIALSWPTLAPAASDTERYFPLCFTRRKTDWTCRSNASDVTWRCTKAVGVQDRCALNLYCDDGAGQVRLALLHNAAELTPLQIDVIAGELEACLALAARDPGISLEDLAQATGRRRLRKTRFLHRGPTIRRVPVLQQFAHAVADNGEAIAVHGIGERCDYRRLAERTNKLAHHLRALGVGPDVRVAVCLPRSADLVVGLVGVLKAGGAYVPLDPSDPLERLSWILEDSGARVVVTSRAWQQPLRESAGVRFVHLESHADVIDACPATPVRSTIRGEHLAYVMYTSGSSGRPKGVMVTHAGLENYLSWALHAYPVKQGTGSAVQSSVGFDLTVTSLFLPLLAGRSVYLVSTPLDAGDLVRESDRGAFSLLKITPSHLRLMAQQVPPPRAARLTHLLVIGGEALHAEDLAWWHAHAPNVRLINEYGPTETVVGSCVHEIHPAHAPAGAVPIGRPIANTQVYVLDAAGDVVSCGVPGELHIGGLGVARGYVSRPALTAERFVPDGFSGRAGARLYRTGDLARWRDDGRLDYLGRIDDQVKVRGYRIEPREVEAALERHPDVEHATVVAAESGSGARLVAYVVAKTTVPASALRAHLQAQLPEYMVPSAFVQIGALPLTPNGKLDRKALPPPPTSDRGTADYVAPRTAQEETLARIWAAVLKRPRIGVTESFFDLGGDSILSIQIVARAHQAGLQILPRDLFKHHTIAAVAAVATPVSGARINQGVVEGSVALTPIQRWFFETPIEERHHFNQAVWLRTPAAVKTAALARVVRRLVAHHDALRMRFALDGTTWRQWNAGLDNDALNVWASVDLTALAGSVRDRAVHAIAEHVQRSLNLQAGPLLRVVHLQVDASAGGRLLVVIHHLVVDGVSWRILLEDLHSAYAAAAAGAPIVWPAKTSPYRDWAAALEAYAAAGPSPQEAAHWLESPAPLASQMPCDTAGPNTRASQRRVIEALPVEETRALLQEIAPAARSHVEELLLAAVWHSLSSWSSEPAWLIELEGHGREELFPDLDVTRTVGWFTSQYPVWLPGDGPMDVWHRLRTVKERLRALPNRGVGYGLWRYSSPDPDLRHRMTRWPKAAVSFNYLGQLDHGLPANGWLATAGGGRGTSCSTRGPRPYIFELVAGIRDGALRLEWTYSHALHRRATVTALAQHCLQTLRDMVAAREAAAAQALSPADFPYARLTTRDMRELLTELNHS